MFRRAGQHPSGFTLIEMVVVVMIIGILAAIAAPRLFTTAGQAADGAARQSLGVIRNAIDTYVAQHEGKFPGADGNAATFTSDLAPNLRGAEFPKCSVGAVKNNAINMVTGTAPVAANIGGTDNSQSWMYNYSTGDFNINSADTSADKTTTYDQF